MKTLLISCFVLLQFSLFSQDWGIYYTDSKVTIEVAKVVYEDKSHGLKHERIIFRYTNNTNQAIQVNFTRLQSYDGVTLAASPEREFTVSLSSNETKSYSEESKRDKKFYVFKKDMNGFIKKKLSSFDITNLTYL